jgi:hypothetical protein
MHCTNVGRRPTESRALGLFEDQTAMCQNLTASPSTRSRDCWFTQDASRLVDSGLGKAIRHSGIAARGLALDSLQGRPLVALSAEQGRVSEGWPDLSPVVGGAFMGHPASSLAASAPSRRPELPPSFRMRLRSVRPSLLDRRFCGDSWIVHGADGAFQLCLGDYNLANIQGSSVDLPGLNNLLDRVRNRPPRRRSGRCGT